MHVDPAPQLPKYVALDLRDETKQFVEGTQKLDEVGIGIDLPTAVSEIIDLLQREEDAEFELSHSTDELSHSDFGQMAQPLTDYLKLREMYAKAMFKHFQLFKLYLRGMLFYQLKDLDSAGLILEKLTIPLNHNDRRIRTIERQADLAHRQRVQATEAQRPNYARWLVESRPKVRRGAELSPESGLVLPPRFLR